MEADSETPCFEKTMTHYMLQKNESLLIPASFIRTHGHMLDEVISLTGLNREMGTVFLRKYSRIRGGKTVFRHYLGTGWKEFVKKNGFQEGDCVLFRLVGNSCLHVLVSSKLQEHASVKTTLLSKSGRERGLGKSGREDDGIIPRTKVARLDLTVNSDRDQARSERGTPRDNVKEAAVVKRSQLSETDFVKHPGLGAAISSNSYTFPHFIRKLSRSNLRTSHDIRLEIPIRFVEEHGHKFQEHVSLLGPNGQWRVVKIIIHATFGSSIRIQFRKGWREFVLESGFEEGDVLLFSLVKDSKFLVQVFPVAAPRPFCATVIGVTPL